MASVRTRTLSDGTITFSLQYRLDGKQPSIAFHDADSAYSWCERFNKLGSVTALEMLRAEQRATESGATVLPLSVEAEEYITTLTGVEDGTRNRYRAYMRNDISRFFGENIPPAAILDTTVKRWINHMEKTGGRSKKGQSPKTIANKHGFLFGLMDWLFQRGKIPSNPCANSKLPRVDMAEMIFLEPEEFAALHAALPRRWRLFVKFMVASGCRWGEITALQVGDIDRRKNTVRVRRAWKYTGGARVLGKPKTKKSKRTINLDAELVAELDLTGRAYSEWLFPNDQGGAIQVSTFYKQVWVPTLDEMAEAVDDPEDDPLNGKRPRIHDMRHTCASWLLNAGTPLMVVQAHLGHESIKTTSDRYGHLDRRTAAQAAATLGAQLPSSQPQRPMQLAAKAVGVSEVIALSVWLKERAGVEVEVDRLTGGTTDRWMFSWFDGPTKAGMRAMLAEAPPHTARIELRQIRSLGSAAA
uniref:tyrosine-type recombinase/integrase n=1 Tax=Micromonospora sp. NBC_00855 TaxID=2975978 RepID=UPI002257939E|nr:site-specific integrase [Micromonospora sp. NBC_00855]